MLVLIGWLTVIGIAIGVIVLAVRLAHGTVKLERMDARWLERQWLAEHREDQS